MSIKLFNYIDETKVIESFYVFFYNDNKEQINFFLENYKDEQVVKVKKAVEDAQKNVKYGKIEIVHYGCDSFISSEFQEYIVKYPVCTDNGICKGDVDLDYKSHFFLNFLVESFKCESCGLKWKILMK